MFKLLEDFQRFIARGNVVDLAVAVVLGTAFNKIITKVVEDIIMPVVGALLPQGAWREFEITPLHLKVGDVLGAILDFLIVAFVVFIVVNKVMSHLQRRELAAPPSSNKKCPECCETIPMAAKRCKACCQLVAVA
jgi:large conductance mechanosensitive channel